jgi:hypothetical protein
MDTDKPDQPIEESYTPEDLAVKNEALSVASDKNVVDRILKEEGSDFMPKTPPAKTPTTSTHSILDHLPGIKVEKTTDDNTLVDIHINNPMRKIIALLEDIKKQKAFSFTLKGSLGIMGVLLALSVFGIFGGGQMLCDKGLQTRSGMLKVLTLTEEATDPSIPWTKAMLQKLFFLTPTTMRQRVVLISNNEPPIHLYTLITHKLDELNGQSVIVTGNYNSCSATLTVANEVSIEAL